MGKKKTTNKRPIQIINNYNINSANQVNVAEDQGVINSNIYRQGAQGTSTSGTSESGNEGVIGGAILVLVLICAYIKYRLVVNAVIFGIGLLLVVIDVILMKKKIAGESMLRVYRWNAFGIALTIIAILLNYLPVYFTYDIVAGFSDSVAKVGVLSSLGDGTNRYLYPVFQMLGLGVALFYYVFSLNKALFILACYKVSANEDAPFWQTIIKITSRWWSVRDTKPTADMVMSILAFILISGILPLIFDLISKAVA